MKHHQIHNISWRSTLVWYIIKARSLLRSAKPAAVVGPQRWAFPPEGFTLKSFVCEVTEVDVEGLRLPVFRPKAVGEPKRIIFYFHGGYYFKPPVSSHFKFVDTLATRLQAIVYMVPYPLAPTNTYQKSIDSVVAFYRAIIANHSKSEIIVAGDSAGGNMALCLPFALRDTDLRLPDQIISISPWLDMSNSNPHMPALEPYDPMLSMETSTKCANAWAKGSFDAQSTDAELQNPRISPLFEDWDWFRDSKMNLILLGGTWEIFAPDIEVLARKLDAIGGKLTWIEGIRLCHVFAIVPGGLLPEAKQAIDIVVDSVSANAKIGPQL